MEATCDCCHGARTQTCIVCKGRGCPSCEPPFSGGEKCACCGGKGYIVLPDPEEPPDTPEPKPPKKGR